MDNLKLVKWAPWHRYREAPDADGDVPEGVESDNEEEANPRQSGIREKIIYVDTKKRPPREFYIKPEDIEKHGKTRGCPGCSKYMGGSSATSNHTGDCRERFRVLLRDNARVINAEKR